MRVYKEVRALFRKWQKGSSVSENCSRCRFDGDDSGDTRGKCNSGRRLGLEESQWLGAYTDRHTL